LSEITELLGQVQSLPLSPWHHVWGMSLTLGDGCRASSTTTWPTSSALLWAALPLGADEALADEALEGSVVVLTVEFATDLAVGGAVSSQTGSVH
jgi:hypothetical protein